MSENEMNEINWDRELVDRSFRLANSVSHGHGSVSRYESV